jgi:hypothetical protein
MWILDYNMSVAVAVGFIALAGVAAETGVVMLIYLDHAWEDTIVKCRTSGREPNATDLYEAVMEGAVERVRPKMMTVVAIMAGLLPILWGTGTGSEVMSRIAAPMVGGMISSTVLTLAVIPALYALVKQWRLKKGWSAKHVVFDRPQQPTRDIDLLGFGPTGLDHLTTVFQEICGQACDDGIEWRAVWRRVRPPLISRNAWRKLGQQGQP